MIYHIIRVYTYIYIYKHIYIYIINILITTIIINTIILVISTITIIIMVIMTYSEPGWFLLTSADLLGAPTHWSCVNSKLRWSPALGRGEQEPLHGDWHWSLHILLCIYIYICVCASVSICMNKYIYIYSYMYVCTNIIRKVIKSQRHMDTHFKLGCTWL